MAGMQPARNPDGTWTYSSSKEVLKTVGLKSIGKYINVPKKTINGSLHSVGMGGGGEAWLLVPFGGSSS